jgi:predicted nucleic acid-binding protein
MNGALVLDSAGLSGYLEQSRKIMLLIDAAVAEDRTLVTSAATIIEAYHPKLSVARLNWVLSRIRIEDVTKDSARASANLLRKARLHGHRCAIDAMVAEAAGRQADPVAVLTSDPDDMSRLCGPRIRVIAV